jgi:hypothetical protein
MTALQASVWPFGLKPNPTMTVSPVGVTVTPLALTRTHPEGGNTLWAARTASTLRQPFAASQMNALRHLLLVMPPTTIEPSGEVAKASLVFPPQRDA